MGMISAASPVPAPPSIPTASPDAAEDGCPVFGGLLEVRSREELEALRGCSSIEGDVAIYPFDTAVDLTPLAELTRVGGMLTLGDLYEDPPAPSFTSLAGLESLRSVGGLSLRGVTARSLEPLAGLVELTLSTGIIPGTAMIFIDHCPQLESLQGLDNLEGVRVFIAKSNQKLTSISGLRVPAELDLFEIWDSPVVDIDALAPLTSVRHTLWFMETGLTSASALAGLDDVGQLQFYRNRDLTDLSGLSALSSAHSLSIIENPSLASLPDFPRLTSVESIGIASNPALTEVGSFSALRRVHDLSIASNDILQRVLGLSGLESAYQVEVSNNAVLEQLDLGKLLSVEYFLRVTHNPLLDGASVVRPAAGHIIVGGNRGDAVGLDPCPWSGNTFCEGSPLDDLCAPGTDSDCPSGEPP